MSYVQSVNQTVGGCAVSPFWPAMFFSNPMNGINQNFGYEFWKFRLLVSLFHIIAGAKCNWASASKSFGKKV